MVKKALLIITASATLASSLTVFSDSKEVNFYNWGDYIAPNVIPDFTAETGIAVNQQFFDSEGMLKTKLSIGNSGYDLVVLNSADMIQSGQIGLIQPIDKSKLPNFRYINKPLYQLVSQVDPGNKYGIIYSYGTTGIAYNVDMVKKVLGPNVKIDSWEFLYNPKYLKKLQNCGVSFVGESNVILGTTKFYLGMNPNDDSPEAYKKAAAYMVSLRPYIFYFDNSRYINDLAAGNICIAMAYSGDVFRAQQVAKADHINVNIQYVIPKEGTMVWFDMLAIPKNAPDPEATLKFINYLLTPQVMADISNYLFQPNAITASTPYLNPLLKNPDISLPEEELRKLFIMEAPPLKLDQLVSDLWFQIKYGVNM